MKRIVARVVGVVGVVLITLGVAGAGAALADPPGMTHDNVTRMTHD
jgi:hypothetical protein